MLPNTLSTTFEPQVQFTNGSSGEAPYGVGMLVRREIEEPLHKAPYTLDGNAACAGATSESPYDSDSSNATSTYAQRL